MANLLRFSVCVVFLCIDASEPLAPRILYGSVTERDKWPFIAALFKRNPPKFFCGGTIISQRHVLTAAHCIKDKGSDGNLTHNQIGVRLGAYNLTNNDEEGSMESKVAEIRVHPDWDPMKDEYDGDVAVLVLSNKIAYTNYIRAVDLPADDLHIDGSTINVTGSVVGWGLADKDIYEPILKEATMIQAINDSYCYRTCHGIVKLSSGRTFCAGLGTGVPNRGDSGGGYFFDNGFELVQYGIVSSVSLNDQGKLVKDSLVVYTNVKSFKEWIMETVNDTMEIKLNCNFEYFFDIYLCRLQALDIQSDNIEIDAFIGVHYPGKTHQDVEEIKFESGTTFFLPSGIGKFFTKLKTLKVGYMSGQSLGVKVIKRSNLENLGKLQELSIYKNEIEILEEDTLWDLPFLEIFELIKNKLKVIHEKTFHKNEKLREVNLQSNKLELLPRDLFFNNNVLERIDFSKNSLKIIEINFTNLMFVKSVILKDNVCINFRTLNGDKVELLRLITTHCLTQ